MRKLREQKAQERSSDSIVKEALMTSKDTDGRGTESRKCWNSPVQADISILMMHR